MAVGSWPEKLNWEPLRARLTQEGVIRGAAGMAKPATVVAPEPGARHEQPDPDAYVVDPARRDERQRLLREHAVRPSQPRFRQALIALSGGAVCAISGCRVETAIQAAHLMPYLGEADHHPANGLLLRADLHLLFDRAGSASSLSRGGFTSAPARRRTPPMPRFKASR